MNHTNTQAATPLRSQDGPGQIIDPLGNGEEREGAPIAKDPMESVPWEKPRLLGDFPQPLFPLDVLPRIGQEIVSAVAKSTATRPDFAALMFLGVLSTAFAKKVKVRVFPDWSENVNLYLVLGAGSAERKSAVCGLMTKPLYEFQKKARKDFASEQPNVPAPVSWTLT